MIKAALFSTYGSGLNDWQKVGSLHRELAVYKRLAEHGYQISLYTYDNSKQAPNVGFEADIYTQWPCVLPKKLNWIYPVLLPFLRFKSGRKNDILITNQAHGGWPAVWAAKFWKARVIARCGMVQGECSEVLGKTSKRTKKKIKREKWTFENADICLIPTEELKQWVVDHYKIDPNKIFVVPNYVDTEQFCPKLNTEKEYDIICIGRLVEKKRHKLLLEALTNSGLKVLIIGAGKLNDDLLDFANKNAVDLRIINRVEHKDLVDYLSKSRVFVNVSQWEGHPKAVIEAMACGCPIVVAAAPGISNLIEDTVTGLVAEPNPRDIRLAIDRLLADAEMCNRLGGNARQQAVNNFSLDVVTNKYKDIIDASLHDI